MARSGIAGARPRLVMVGGGHAHLAVLRSIAEDDWPDVDAVFVSPQRRQFYSGMVPGYLQGRYRAEELSLDLPALCRAAGIRFVEARAERVDANERLVGTTAGAFPFALASLDVGSVPRGLNLPGVCDHAYFLRPMNAAEKLRERVDALGSESATVRLVVVGAGAGGVEAALAVRRRVADAGADSVDVLVDRGPRILGGFSDRARARARDILEDVGIRVVTGRAVLAMESGTVRLSGGAAVDADVTVWTTGPAPPRETASTSSARTCRRREFTRFGRGRCSRTT